MRSKPVDNSKQTALEQRMAAQRAHINQLSIENEQLFNTMLHLIREQAVSAALKEALLREAMKEEMDSIPDALNRVQNQHGQSLLQKAFQTQQLSLAARLVNLGATITPRDQAAFELALDGPEARELGYDVHASPEVFHPVKYYGLVLGIEMTSQDGTHSQIAHIAPTYRLMTHAVSDYAMRHPDNKPFKAIADAFQFSNATAKFSYSTTQNPKAGEAMAKRILQGKPTTVPVACKGHIMGLSVVPDGPGSTSGYLVFTNRGVGSSPADCGTQIYRLDDLKKINPTFINQMMNGLSQGKSYEAIREYISQVTDHKPPIHHIKQAAQKRDNCSIANPCANLEGMLVCLKAIEKGGFKQLTQDDLRDAKACYKDFTHAMRADLIKQLADGIRKNPKDNDLIDLAKGYLKEHPNAHASLTERLKAVLTQQTVGLATTAKNSEVIKRNNP